MVIDSRTHRVLSLPDPDEEYQGFSKRTNHSNSFSSYPSRWKSPEISDWTPENLFFDNDESPESRSKASFIFGWSLYSWTRAEGSSDVDPSYATNANTCPDQRATRTETKRFDSLSLERLPQRRSSLFQLQHSRIQCQSPRVSCLPRWWTKGKIDVCWTILDPSSSSPIVTLLKADIQTSSETMWVRQSSALFTWRISCEEDVSGVLNIVHLLSQCSLSFQHLS